MKSKKVKKHHIGKQIIKSIIILLLSFLVTLLYLGRQFLIDQINVINFKPAQGVLELVDRAGMNGYGKFLYLASSPTLKDSTEFNNSCNRVESTTAILGCYSKDKIYIYNVIDPQLDGIREVTATHETLHAIYVRLNYFEKIKVNKLLDDEYGKLADNKAFQEKMAFYDRTESEQKSNELHSIIATEISSISPELEAYYSKYFDNRQKVIDLNNKYISVFRNIETKALALKSEIDNLLVSITDRSSKYGETLAALNNDINLFNAKAENNQFSSQSQFNAERNLISDRINSVNLEMGYINQQINQYNSILNEYNSLATRSQDLYNSLDSALTAPPSI